MKPHPPTPLSHKIRPVLLVLPFVLASPGADAATMLDFEGLGGNVDIAPEFADFATANGTGFTVSSGIQGILGTPNINLGWVNTDHIMDSYTNWGPGRGTTAQFDFTRAGVVSNTISLPFTPNATSGVLITQFDLDEYSGGGAMQIDWAILNGTNIITSGSWFKGGDGRDTIFTGMTEAQAIANAGSPITLQFTKVSGGGSYFAVDNLAFDQVVTAPEPTTAGLVAAGLGAMAMRRRRKVS